MSAVITLVISRLGMQVGLDFWGGFPEFGLLAAIAAMGGFIICFNKSKKAALSLK